MKKPTVLEWGKKSVYFSGHENTVYQTRFGIEENRTDLVVRVATLYFQMWIRVVTRHRSVLEPPVAPARFSGRSYSSQVSLWRSSSRTFFTGQPTSDRSPSPHLTGPEIRVLGRVMGSPKKGFLFARLMFCLSFPIIVGSFCEGWRGSNTQHSSIVITYDFVIVS